MNLSLKHSGGEIKNQLAPVGLSKQTEKSSVLYWSIPALLLFYSFEQQRDMESW